MQNQQSVASGLNLPGLGQGVGQQVPQTTLSNIIVGQPTTAASAQRALTGEAISRHAQAAAKAGPGVFWQIARPTRTLKLSGAVNYINKNYPGREGAQRFVYWPDYRVAGTVQDIVNAFRQAGITTVQTGTNPQNNQPIMVPLTEQAVLGASLDPLNPQQRALIDQLSQAGATGATGKKAQRHTLEEYIMIGNALRAASKQQASVTTGTTATTTRGGATGTRGGRTPQAAQQRLVAAFEQMMTQALSGAEVPKVFDVTRFDPAKFTGARPVAPPKTGRATAIRPVIDIQGRRIQLPIIAQPAGAAQFQAFMQNIVGQSRFAQIVPYAIQSFQQMLQSRQTAVGVSQPGFAQQPQQMGGFGMLPQQQVGGLGSLLPQQQVQGLQLPSQGLQLPSQGFQLPQVGQTSGANIMSQLSNPTGALSPSSPRSGAVSPAPQVSLGQGLQLPITGAPGISTQLPQVTSQGGLQLPQVQGTSLPTVGGTGYQLPQVQGNMFQTLPSVGLGSTALPSVQLPGQNSLGGSPQ